MIRNLVLSDTGGWLPQLLNTFDQLGINAEEGTMPKNMRIIHCGDLIHKGPYSSQLLAIVTNLMVMNPGQWIQLMGNHEAQHIPGAPRFWECMCTERDIGLMNALHRENFMLPSFAINSVGKLKVNDEIKLAERLNILFTHGGLTAGFWQNHTNNATNSIEVAQRLNELPINEVSTPGLLLGYPSHHSQVGPIWAIGNTEVFNSWREVGDKMPFTQFHGHTTSFNFTRNFWYKNLDNFRSTVTLLPTSRTVVSELNNNLLMGVDPGFSESEPSMMYQTWFEFETEA